MVIKGGHLSPKAVTGKSVKDGQMVLQKAADSGDGTQWPMMHAHEGAPATNVTLASVAAN